MKKNEQGRFSAKLIFIDFGKILPSKIPLPSELFTSFFKVTCVEVLVLDGRSASVTAASAKAIVHFIAVPSMVALKTNLTKRGLRGHATI